MKMLIMIIAWLSISATAFLFVYSAGRDMGRDRPMVMLEESNRLLKESMATTEQWEKIARGWQEEMERWKEIAERSLIDSRTAN